MATIRRPFQGVTISRPDAPEIVTIDMDNLPELPEGVLKCLLCGHEVQHGESVTREALMHAHQAKAHPGQDAGCYGDYLGTDEGTIVGVRGSSTPPPGFEVDDMHDYDFVTKKCTKCGITAEGVENMVINSVQAGRGAPSLRCSGAAAEARDILLEALK